MSFHARRGILWIAFLGSIAIVALFAAITNGTTLARLSFEELTRRATAINFRLGIGEKSVPGL